MRLVPKKKEVRVFLSQSEYWTYLDHCDDRLTFVFRTEGETSSRISTTCSLLRKDFFIPKDPDVDIAFVRLRETKDTTEGENALNGNHRLSWVPRSLYEFVQDYCEKRGIGPNEEIIKVDPGRLYQIIRQKSKEIAAQTGIEGYKYVRSHDFRAYYATNMIRRLGVSETLVMDMGDWENRKSLEPYLATPLEEDIQAGLAKAGVLEIETPANSRSDFEQKLLNRLERIENALNIEQSPVELGDLTKSQIERVIEDHQDNGEDHDKYDLSNPRISDYNDPVATDPVTPQLAARLYKEYGLIDESPDPDIGFSPARTAVTAVGLLSGALLLGTTWALNGQLEAILAGDPTATASGMIAVAIALPWMVWDTHNWFHPDPSEVEPETTLDKMIIKTHAVVDPIASAVSKRLPVWLTNE